MYHRAIRNNIGKPSVNLDVELYRKCANPMLQDVALRADYCDADLHIRTYLCSYHDLRLENALGFPSNKQRSWSFRAYHRNAWICNVLLH